MVWVRWSARARRVRAAGLTADAQRVVGVLDGIVHCTFAETCPAVGREVRLSL